MRFYGIANSEEFRSLMGNVDALWRDLREQLGCDKMNLAADYEEREAFGLKMDSYMGYLALRHNIGGDLNRKSD